MHHAVWALVFDRTCVSNDLTSRISFTIWFVFSVASITVETCCTLIISYITHTRARTIATLVTGQTSLTIAARLECTNRTSCRWTINIWIISSKNWSVVIIKVVRANLYEIKSLDQRLRSPARRSAQITRFPSTVTNSSIVTIISCRPAVFTSRASCAGYLVNNIGPNWTFWWHNASSWTVVVRIISWIARCCCS